MDAQLKKIVMGNTAVKIVGMNDEPATLKAFSNASRAHLEDLQALDVGQFFLKSGKNKAFPFKAPAHLLGNKDSKYYMSPAEIQRVRAQQIAQYYRTTKEVPSPSEPGQPPPTTQDSPTTRTPKYKFD